MISPTLLNLLPSLPADDDAVAATAYNALPRWHRPIEAHQFLGWSGAWGRLLKLKGFVATDASTVAAEVRPTFQAVQCGVEAMLAGVNNPKAFITLNPGGEQRQLLDAAVTLGVLSADDAAGLVSIGLDPSFAPVTALDVEAARLVAAAREWARGEAEKNNATVNAYVTACEKYAAGTGERPGAIGGG